jgi:hypothetical protein
MVSNPYLHNNFTRTTSLSYSISAIGSTSREMVAGNGRQTIVTECRCTRLTKSEDKAISLVDIAQAMHNTYGLTYLAGLWSESALICLAWRVESSTWSSPASRKPTKEAEEPGVSIVPTRS